MERARIELARSRDLRTSGRPEGAYGPVKSAGPFALGSGSRLAAVHIEASLKLAERFPDEPGRREARLRLQAAASFLGVEIYASVKVEAWLRGSGHTMRPLI